MKISAFTLMQVGDAFGLGNLLDVFMWDETIAIYYAFSSHKGKNFIAVTETIHSRCHFPVHILPCA